MCVSLFLFISLFCYAVLTIISSCFAVVVFLLSWGCKCPVSIPQIALDWFAECYLGVFWSYSLLKLLSFYYNIELIN